ncbi:hypothetical protein GQX74_012916 [Glossina fuscipes]|nr:hypothetical protein GQX74_012916 [Glossina fuscipes]
MGRKLSSKKRFCIYSDSSSDHSNEKIAANNSTRRKRRHNPDSEKMIFRFGKKCFKDTYHISDGRLYDCCNKEQVSLWIVHRGRHAAGNKIDHPQLPQYEVFPGINFSLLMNTWLG